MKLEHSRRSFLRALGAGATALPFFKLLESSAVHAQTGDAPMRLVTVFHPHGASSPLFSRQDGETETDFDIAYSDCVLRCFDDADTYGASFKDKLVAIDGIDLVAGINGGKTGHDAVAGVFTGSAGPNGPLNSSIEQYLAVDQGLGSDTRFSSLVLGVGFGGSEPTENISYSSGGVLMPKIINPQETFNLVFKDLVAGQDPSASAEIDRQRALGKSVLDYVASDIGRIRPRLAAPEQSKLDLHLTTLRELEKRLEGAQNACEYPSDPGPFPYTETWNQGGPYLHEITQLQLGFLAQAMACDLTRFASVFLCDLSRGANQGTGINDVPDDNHEGLAHQYRPEVYDGTQLVDPGDATSWSNLGKVNHYNYSCIASFMQQLNDFGLLDDTLIYMSGEMGDPSLHSSVNVPTVLLGGAGGKFPMGRHVKLKTDCPMNQRWCSGQEQYVSQNGILVAIAQAFGVQTDSYGDSGVGSGALPELLQAGVSL
jgi:hypothetical protein